MATEAPARHIGKTLYPFYYYMETKTHIEQEQRPIAPRMNEEQVKASLSRIHSSMDVSRNAITNVLTRFFVFALAFSLFGNTASAQTLLPVEPCINDGSCSLSQFPGLLWYVSNYLVSISASIAVIMLMVGAYQKIWSGVGKEGGQASAMNTIKYALLGLIVTLTSWILVNVVIVNFAS